MPKRASGSKFADAGARRCGPRQAEREGVARANSRARQSEIGARAMGQPRQKKARPDIGEKADADFRHGEGEMIARDKPGAMRGDADAAAHHNAVDQRDIGLGVSLDAAVQLVFLAPEGQLRGMVASPALLIEPANVAARAKGPPTGARHDDSRDGIVALPGVERRGNGAHHAQIERVEGLGPVEDDRSGAAASFDPNLGLAHRFSSTGREIIKGRRRFSLPPAGRERTQA